MIVTVLMHPKYLQCPPTCAVALLHCHTKLVNVDELASRHLENSKRKAIIPEAVNTKLNVITKGLIVFSGSSLL
jgi:hypothetical protein